MAKIKTRRYHIYYWFKVLFFILSRVPYKVGIKIASLFGGIAYLVLPKYRNIAISNLDSVFGVHGDRNKEVTLKMFKNLSKNGLEWMKMFRMSKKDIVGLVDEAEGLEHLDEALAYERGVIAITGHFGNWELIMSYIRSKGYSGASIAKKMYFHKYNEFVKKLRSHRGDKIIFREESPKKMLRVLKDNQILGILADQDVDSINGIFVNFFGKKAYTATAPVKLALATGALLVPVFIMRKDDGKHKLVVEKPIIIETETNLNKDQLVEKYTQLWTSIIEKYIRVYPEQWVWLHKRWKTQETTV